MWAAIKLFFSNNTAKLIEWGAILAAAAGVVLEIFTSGKKSEKVDELRTVQQEEGKAHAVEDVNKLRPDGAAADELRSQWSR